MKPMPDPLPRPDASEYEEFQDYEHVRTVGDDQDSDKVNVDNETLKVFMQRNFTPKFYGLSVKLT